MSACIDEVGNRYGLLTVIERVKTPSKGARWRCICECGNECIVRGADLRRETTRSCGCLNEMQPDERIERGIYPAKWRAERRSALSTTKN